MNKENFEIIIQQIAAIIIAVQVKAAAGSPNYKTVFIITNYKIIAVQVNLANYKIIAMQVNKAAGSPYYKKSIHN